MIVLVSRSAGVGENLADNLGKKGYGTIGVFEARGKEICFSFDVKS